MVKLSYHDIAGDAYLKIESYNLKDYVKLINAKEIKNIVVNDSWGYYLPDVEFLRDCPAVEKISIVNNEIDISGITYCNHLKALYAKAEPLQKISLAVFPQLENLSFTYCSNWLDLAKCEKLVHLLIWQYPSANLSDLSNMRLLKTLTIAGSKIENLGGIESLAALQDLHMEACSKFTQIGPAGTNPNLQSIHLESCRKFNDHSKLAQFPNLISLIIKQTSPVKDVYFVEKLQKLQRLVVMDATIENGDIEVLKRIPELSFDQKKHYSFNLQKFLVEKYC